MCCRRYIASIYGIIDLVTILPVFVSVLTPSRIGVKVGILRFVMVLRALRILRV